MARSCTRPCTSWTRSSPSATRPTRYIYAAQASDGDAFGADPEKSRSFLVEKLLPKSRYFAYIEVGDEGSTRASSLSAAYRRIESPRFAMRGVQERGDIYPVFRELFGRQAA